MAGEPVRMAANGRLVLPASLRAELGMDNGGALVAEIEDGVVKLTPLSLIIRRIQQKIRTRVPEGVDLAQELIDERREEALRE